MYEMYGAFLMEYFMRRKLFVQAMTKFVLGFVLVALLIFVPAGTFLFANGWLFMCILFIPMFFVGVALLFKKPELLKKRINAKEKQKEQGILIKISGLIFVTGFTVAGLGFRFNWYTLPSGAVLCGVMVFILAYILYMEVLRENIYLSRTVEVQENQKVINTGLYGIIRHPMYTATLLLFLSMPVVLGSIYSFFIFLMYPFVIVKRIKYEEKFLKKELNGYCEYKQKVKYRLIPYVW